MGIGGFDTMGDGDVLLTPEGGLAIKLLNKTGADSVKGTLVNASDTTDEAFALSPADCICPIGVVYQDGRADGELTFVVISGVAEVLLEDSTAATKGYWVRTSTTQIGRADATTQLPSGGTIAAIHEHMSEIGHCIKSAEAGTDVLIKIIMHFN